MKFATRTRLLICVYSVSILFMLHRTIKLGSPTITNSKSSLETLHIMNLKEPPENIASIGPGVNVINIQKNQPIIQQSDEAKLPVSITLSNIIASDISSRTHQEKTDNGIATNISNRNNQTKTEKIILWYVKTRYTRPILEPKPLRNCPWQCAITTNHDYHNTSSALVFAAQIIKEETPPRRYGDQVFVLHNHEAQCTFPGINNQHFRNNHWQSQVNWTMWYRHDADIHEPYGLIQKRNVIPNKDYQDIVNKKTKLAAWVISNCGGQARRMKYAKELQKYVDIDIFGLCGNMTCSRGKDDTCLDLISQNYKFYLGFESSFSPDYITEKLFRYYRADIVVIARGGANYTKYVPEKTYINTQDFKSIKELGDYIQRLDKNNEEYISLLKNKDRYESLYEAYNHVNNKNEVTYSTYHYEEQPFCDLCKRLWNVDKYRSWYDDFGKWFDKKPCFPPNDLK